MLFKKHYSIKIATTKEEKEKIFKFRYQIYHDELGGYFLDNIEAHNKMLYDEYDFQDNIIILYAGEINDITGTIRLKTWDKNNLPLQFVNKYHIENSLLQNVDTIGELRYFQVRKDKRKSFLGIMLLYYLYKTISENPAMVNDIIFCDCQPGLLPLYTQVGCFVYMKKMLFEPYGILQIPLAIATFDLKYLKQNQTITYYIAKHYYNAYKKKVGNTIAAKKSRDFNTIIPHFSLFYSYNAIKKYLQTMDIEQQRLYDFILQFLQHYIVISLDPHSIIIKNNIVDYDMFLILSGRVGVYIDNQLIAELPPGTLIGEMALFDQTHKRYADVISISTTAILLIPRNLLARLTQKDLRAANHLLVLLCNSLLSKLAMANKHLCDKLEHNQKE